MKAPESPISQELQQVSLLLCYPRWMKGFFIAMIIGCVFFVVMPFYVLMIRISEGREEKEWVAISCLVVGFGAAAIFLIRHFGRLSHIVKVSAESLVQGETEMRWSDLKSVWYSAFFGMLRVKDRKGQVLTFFPGLLGYEVLAMIAKEKKEANQAPTQLWSAPR